MKKIFTLIATSMVAAASFAQTTKDYNCALAVLVDGEAADPQEKVVSTTFADDKYTLELKNFILYTQGQPMPVGTISVPDIAYTIDEDGDTIISTKQNITIANGDDPNVTFWLGPTLQEVPISLEGGVNNGVLGAVLNIPFGTMNINVYVSSAATQIANSNFEGWHTASFKPAIGSAKTSDEPNNWHSFMSSTGTLASFVAGTPHTWKSEDLRPGATGTASVIVKSAKVFGQSANGTITTGRLNAGDGIASSTNNNSFLDLSNTDTDANGDPFYTKIEGYPDSLAVWVKFHAGDGNNNPTAVVSAILTDGTYYQDPEKDDADYTNVVAKANNSSIESNNEAWQRIVVPFDYETYYDNDAEARAMLVTISTCSVPGGGSKSDKDPDAITIDDFSLIYNAKLNSISINGDELENFDKDKFEYNVAVDALPTADDIDYEEDAENSLVEVMMPDEKTAKLSVISNDLKTVNTYTLNFKLNATGIDNAKAEAAPVATYGLNGQKLNASAKAPVVIKKYADGTVRKVVK